MPSELLAAVDVTQYLLRGPIRWAIRHSRYFGLPESRSTVRGTCRIYLLCVSPRFFANSYRGLRRMAHLRQWKRGNRVEDFLTRDARGLALIITNDYHGTDTLSNLDGTTADGDKMVEAFGEFFGFDCVRGKNLVSGDIKELVKSASECSSLANRGCLAFIFSGHGGEGVIYGEDQNLVDAYVDILEDIVQPFDPQKSPSIAEVPKLFFIDACRGGESVKGAGGKGKWIGDGRLKEAATKSSTTLLGNYILGYATMPGFKSYLRGDNAEGSVWMPLLADELQYEPNRDVLNVLQDVNGRLKRDYESKRISQRTFQQPHFESTCADPVNLFLISGSYTYNS